jgi:putative inorganic carbon (hco3(-)) transporter
MIEERPVVGWGPGTYQFVYAPFQKNKYKTIITTNFGDGGNAHSEFIGPCAETGFMGLISVLALMLIIIYTGIQTYLRAQNPVNRILSLAATLALISYYIHGVLNNFLDTDKLSLPFWGAFAVIIVVNIIEKQNNTITKDN